MVKNRAVFSQKGPLLVVANHPNSFLDAILIGSYFTENVHFLARGDAFKQKKYRFLLKMLKMIPVYRLSEGRENLHLNEYTFSESKRILEAGGILLIFIEGICKNTHELQPFKKGAARIALQANTPTPLRILPVAIAYDSFSRFGKNVLVSAGNPIPVTLLFPYGEESRNYLFFNAALKSVLEVLLELPEETATIYAKPQQWLAVLGRILHQPLYRMISRIIRKKTAGTVFYDSVLFGTLLITYVIYLILLNMIIYGFTGSLLPAIPVTLLHIISAKFAILCRQRV